MRCRLMEKRNWEGRRGKGGWNEVREMRWASGGDEQKKSERPRRDDMLEVNSVRAKRQRGPSL